MRVLGARVLRATTNTRSALASSTHSARWQLHRAFATDVPPPAAEAASSGPASGTTTAAPTDAAPAAPAATPSDASSSGASAAAAATVASASSVTRVAGRRRARRAAPPPDAPLPQFFSSMGFPNLIEPAPLMDAAETKTFLPGKGSRLRFPATVTVRNDPSMFEMQREFERRRKAAAGEAPTDDVAAHNAEVAAVLDEGISPAPFLRRFATQSGAATHAYMLLFRRVVNQTPKGRRPRFAALTCVGNGAGLVGYGEGKDEEPARAQELAYLQALRNMDRVERFEQRTLFTELRTKLGATQVIMRPRPVGFGLRTNPYIHQILKAAGIKDVSAKVWGSRNPLNVIKATFRMLWAGHAPQGMGDGIGGAGKKLEKGGGVRTQQDVERERGRRLLDLRT